MYADDLKIFKPIFSLRDIFDLQVDLNNVVSWSDRNGLPFNIAKCFHMSFHRRRNILISEYRMKGHLLRCVDEILDLGVVFDFKLTFISHLNFIIPKAYSLSAFIRRNLDRHFDQFAKKIVYTSFVRSKLEYASFIWSPNAAIHIARIERIQRKFVKFALPFFNYHNFYDGPSFANPSYEDKCKLISLKTLETRRNISALNFLHGVICGVIDSPELLNLISINVPPRTFRNISKFFHIDIHRTEYALNEPLNKAMRLFNMHCTKLDLSVSHSQFRTMINNLF